MISLTCTSCKRVLEIDDAFAGGVCRCRHCGTIQTVPSSLKAPGRSAAPSNQPIVTSAKALYQRPQRAGDAAAADTVSAAPSPAAAPAPVRAAAPQAPAGRAPSTLRVRAAIAAAVLLAAIIVLVLWLTIR